MPDIVLLGVILAAIVIGYLLGRRDQERKKSAARGRVSKDYFVGLNYLINEQTDEAIDVFIKALDIKNDTVDTYLALGSLFSKRGEVEKSIRVHQDLLARPSLTATQSYQVQLALAQNYASAGLLDRSETILNDLSHQNHPLREQALQQLLRVYEQERDWEQAVEVANTLRPIRGEQFSIVLAHYYCELCEIALRHNDRVTARRLLRQAFARDRNSVRASLLLGQMAFDEGSYKSSVKTLQKIAAQDISFVPLALPLLEKACRHTGDLRGYEDYLNQCLHGHPTTAVIIAMARLFVSESGQARALNFLTTQLERHPTLKGLNELVGLQRQFRRGLPESMLALIQRLTERLLAQKPVFSCTSCGFSGKELHWQCPRCHHWGTIKPIQGFEGE